MSDESNAPTSDAKPVAKKPPVAKKLTKSGNAPVAKAKPEVKPKPETKAKVVPAKGKVGENMIKVLSIVKALGGVTVAVDKIRKAAEKKGIEVGNTNHYLYTAYHKDPPLLKRVKHEDKSEDFTLTAAGNKLLAE